MNIEDNYQQKTLDKSLIDEAVEYLSDTSDELKTAISIVGTCKLSPGELPPFVYLVRAIISQQLSSKAAGTIFKRVIDAVAPQKIEPKFLLSTSEKTLKNCGLSSAKLNYIRNLSTQVESGSINFEKYFLLSDREVIDDLLNQKGVGIWTAEMFLIFCLGRPDIISIHDVGIARSIQKVFDLQERPCKEHIHEISLAWAPYRSIASWYLWKYLDINS